MDHETWQPLGVEGVPEFEGLTDGVPEWLSESFWTWMGARFTVRVHIGGGQYTNRFDLSLLRRAERVCRFSTGYTEDLPIKGAARLRHVARREGIELRLADFVLANGANDLGTLKIMLTEAGSAWTVGTRAGKPGLVKRVEAGVQVAAEHTMNTQGRAGERLAEAWTAAYGLSPDPSRAYALAIKAVEDAAIPVVEPNNQAATLGTVTSRMRTVPFRFEVPREKGDVTSQGILLSMMKLLWQGQGDRHGGLPDASVIISQQEGEAAVLLAVPLVQLFTSGAVSQAASA